MHKLNPLHIERIVNGESPERINPEKGTGQTTANALRLLADAMETPNAYVFAADGKGSFANRLATTERALALAKAAGLSHIHSVPGERDAIVFEYRRQEADRAN